MMITAQLRPPSPGASMLPPHVKSVGDRARAGPDRHIRRMMSYVMNLRECATGHNALARWTSAVGGSVSGRGSEAGGWLARPQRWAELTSTLSSGEAAGRSSAENEST